MDASLAMIILWLGLIDPNDALSCPSSSQTASAAEDPAIALTNERPTIITREISNRFYLCLADTEPQQYHSMYYPLRFLMFGLKKSNEILR